MQTRKTPDNEVQTQPSSRSNATVMNPLKTALIHSINHCNDLNSFKKIHALLLTSTTIRHESVLKAAVDFFGRSTSFVDYACIFLKHRHFPASSFPFNSLILNYANTDVPEIAVSVYNRLVRDGFRPDLYTFPAVLKSCAKFAGIKEGKEVHGAVVKMGFVCDLYVQNSVVHFYSVCGDCDGAGKLFDEMLVRDVVSWTGIISGCVRSGMFDEAVSRFLSMDVQPNVATFVSVLVACGRKGFLNAGKGVHGLIIKRDVRANLETNNALIDMYVKCECLSEAMQVFEELWEKDIVSWTSVISGLVQCKRAKEALEMFWDMQRVGVEPDKVILTSVLSACASIGALDYGRWVHEYIDSRDIKWDVQIGTSMVDMYAKCGCLEMALQIFNGMSSKNVKTWNVLLNGLAIHGYGREAVKLFEEMVRIGVRPNEVTFLSILTACCHSGLVDEGQQYFSEMTSRYNLAPKLEHYGCMVDLLCRAGLLDKALDLVKSMPMLPDVLIMGAILSACKAGGNVQHAPEILEHLVEIESHDSGAYVLLSNIYASNERWADVKRIRMLMKEKGIKKAPGSSVIEVNGKAYEFVVGDSNHPHKKDIRILLEFLADQIFLEGQYMRPFMLL